MENGIWTSSQKDPQIICNICTGITPRLTPLHEVDCAMQWRNDWTEFLYWATMEESQLIMPRARNDLPAHLLLRV